MVSKNNQNFIAFYEVRMINRQKARCYDACIRAITLGGTNE